MKPALPRTLVRIGALFGVLALAAFDAAAQQLPQLILPHGGSPGSQGREVRSGTLPVRFNAAAIHSQRPGADVELSLPNGGREVFVSELSQDHGGGIRTWIGQHKDYGNRFRAIVTTGPGGSFGLFASPRGTWRLIPGAEGNDLLVNLETELQNQPPINLANDVRIPPPEPKRLSSGTATLFTPIPGVNTLAFAKVAPSPSYTFDIMFVYTQGLAQNLGANLMTRLYFLVASANTAYTDSEVAMQMRLVNATMVNYPDTGDNGVALNAITPGAGGFDAATFGGIDVIRTLVGADAVALMRNGSNFGGSGIAWLSNTSPNSNSTYSVTTGCVASCESVFIHEVGHNMGNSHDRATAAWQAGGIANPTNPTGRTYPFGYYYCSSGLLSCNPNLPPGSGGCAANTQPECSTPRAGSNNFADIMAYFQGTTTSNLKFSNPAVTCQGATGPPLPCGVADVADTARSMNDSRVAFSSVKTSTITTPPGAIQFASSFVSGTEGTSLTFNVSRVGGSVGALSVNYATANLTAIAGQDYTAQSGTLNWANGDTANKQITVPITNDGVSEDAELFTVTLSSPGGPTGVFLGYPTTATGLILGTWPPGNVMPAGFVTPDGSAGGAWTVASDQFNDASFSLRSANPLGPGDFTTYVNSDLSYTATFVAGTLGFAHKVSAYPSLAALEFSIDGVVVLTNGASSSAWQYYTTAITAGTHTIRWRFKNALPFPCASASPAPPDGGSCADRAWIDSVILPLAAPTVTTVVTDLNKDGKSDLLYRNFSTGQVYRMLMNGLTITSAALAYTEPNTTWRIISDADFNGDGVADYLWRNSSTGQIYLMPNSLSGFPAGGGFIYTEPNAAWKIVHTPDLDGDGKADLLWWNSTTGQVFGMLWNGSAFTVQGFIHTEPNTAWKIVAVGDFAGSGKKNQLLWRNSTTGQVYLMTVTVAGGVFSVTGAQIYQEPNTAWKIVAAADFNGDGKSDILWRNDATGQVYMMLMNGGAITGQAMIHTEPNLAWKIVAQGDYNGDGKADLLWRNDATGQVYMMLMNGLSISNQAMVYGDPNLNWRILGPLEYAQ